MNLSFYNIDCPKYLYNNELVCIHPNILLADSFVTSSMSSIFLTTYLELETYSDEMIYKLYELFFSKQEGAQEFVDRVKENYPFVKKTQQKKHKTKADLSVIGNFKTIIRAMLKQLIAYYENRLKNAGTFHLLPFVDDGILKLTFLRFMDLPDTEAQFITDISATIFERESILQFDPSVEEMFNFTPYDFSKTKETEFIKIPLWNLPRISGLSYEEMQHIRQHLKPALDLFKSQLKALSKELHAITYEDESLHLIKQKCIEGLSNFIEPVQHSINQSLYLNKLRNQFPSDHYLKFCLGISTAETLVNYYEKKEIIEPYMASEIKQRVERHIGLSSSNFFAYYEIYPSNE